PLVGCASASLAGKRREAGRPPRGAALLAGKQWHTESPPRPSPDTGEGGRGRRASKGTSMSGVIETRGLTKAFRGRTAVSQLTLSVPQGAIYALLGDNGAGK